MSHGSRSVSPDLYRHWIHSDEEYDAAKRYRTFRPAGYALPPSRGREELEIKEDGTFVVHAIAPSDGSLTIVRKWRLDGGKLVVVGEKTVHEYRIISVSKDKLVLQDLSSQ